MKQNAFIEVGHFLRTYNERRIHHDEKHEYLRHASNIYCDTSTLFNLQVSYAA